MKQYIECQNCGTLHFVTDEKSVKLLKKDFEEFSERNLKYCFGCGSKDHFVKVTADYVSEFSTGDTIHPLLYSDAKTNKTTKKAKS